ncbi:hypothetical protein HF1_11870 [Mycoplasma haemofelis str. Langford 1]|uniref:Uncharacterized protein n=1 Tax=Mycoplasma haemofelis (strain Langford 1) TaxID=941640 RepID=E8ZJ74_MYCHL|nr:hypothetical protein [Mycoplasma haemofelis]CBY93195.1 hypothetical protein HF1_11870 [Mycoplasma haemofelis str. Langford 1]
MDSSTVINSLFGILGAGAIGSTSFMGYTFFKEMHKTEEYRRSLLSVAELLAKDKTKVLLNRSDGITHQDWKTAWNHYRKENNSASKAGEDPLKVTNFVSKKGEESVLEDFLNRCDLESKRWVSSDKDTPYINVLKWCTKDKK